MRQIHFLMAAMLLCAMACRQPSSVLDQTQVPLLHPPIPALDPAFSSWEWDVEKPFHQLTEHGSVIDFPAQSFVDAQGNVVTGTVQLKFREFKDASGPFLAGIPMTYQSTPFSTAGSFELRAEQSGAPLFLRDKHCAQVKLASWYPGDDYDFFYLNEQSRDWEGIGTGRPEINTEKQKLKTLIDKTLSQPAFPLNRQYLALNYMGILDVYYNNDLSNTKPAEVDPKLEAYGLGYADVYNYDQIQFEGKDEIASLMVWKNIDKVAFPEWVNKELGTVRLIKGHLYELGVANSDSTKLFKVRLEAIMPMKALFAFSPEDWNKRYAATMQKVRDEQERYRQMASVYRTFEVSRLGIYNWDKLMKEEGNIRLDANFLFKSNVNDKLSEIQVVYLTGDNSGYITFNQENWKTIPLVPDPKGRLLSVLPGDKIAYYTADRYARLPFDKLRKDAKPTYEFKMDELDGVSGKEAIFRKLIGI